MAKKELEFSVKFDTQDFDKAVSSMQKRLTELYAPSEQMKAQQNTAQRLQNMGMGGIAGPNMDSMKKSIQQARKELDNLIRDQAKAQRDLGMEIAKHANSLDKLTKQQSEMVKGSREELQIQQEIARTKSNSAKMSIDYKQRDAILNQMLDQKQKEADQAEKARQNSTLLGRMGGAVRGMTAGGIGTGLGGLAAAGLAGSGIYQYLAQAPINAVSAGGRATQGTFGREIQSAYSGQTPFDLAFMGEKSNAASMAMEASRRRQQMAIPDLGMRMLGGAGAGMATGAMMGSAIPGIGTAIGAGVGGLVGAAGVGLSNKSTLLSGLSENAKKDMQAQQAEEFANDFAKALEGEKLSNPLKNIAVESYSQRYSRDLDTQRGLGLNYNSFHGAGGFRENAINAGFSDDMASQSGMAILGAGGSTRMGRESTFGLQAQRGFGLTNANQVLGMLSGSMGSSANTKQATIEILAEGIKKGFGTDDFAEENRRFVQATAEAVVRSGASGGAAGDIASRFGNFVAEKTPMGIQAASSAYQEANEGMSQTGGPGGAMRAAGLLRDQDLQKLSPVDRAALMNIPDDQMDADNPVVKSIARRMGGMSADSLAKKMKGINRGSLHRLSGADQLSNKIIGLQKKLQTENDPAKKDALNKQIQEAQEDEDVYNAVERPDLAKDRKKLSAFTAGTTGLNPEDQQRSSALMDGINAKLGSKTTGRVEDETVGAVAESGRLALKTFQELKGEIVQTASAVGAFNDKLREVVKIAMGLPELQKNAMFSKLFGKPANQSQAGKQGQ